MKRRRFLLHQQQKLGGGDIFRYFRYSHFGLGLDGGSRGMRKGGRGSQAQLQLRILLRS